VEVDLRRLLRQAAAGADRQPGTAGAALIEAQAATKPPPAQFLRVDALRRAVGLTLIAADGRNNNGFNFDGYGRGELIVSVPLGWRVTVRCENHGALRESCAVVSGPDASRPAFRGASTPDPVQGMPSGEQATFSFVAARPGTYRLASLVPGHEQARMYAVLDVTRGGRPSISARPGP
jgi:hypothetical protein